MSKPNLGIDISKARYRDKPSRGLGDTVAKVIKTATFGLVKHCGGCEERRKRLNELVPYKTDATIKE
jgi:hypothetical protein